jgi:subtilisin family serine protease
MTQDPQDDDDFDPTEMERRLVARPLLEKIEQIEEEEEFQPESFGGAEAEPSLVPVVIDLNFKFKEGLKQAKANVIDLLERNGVQHGGRDGQRIQRRKTRLARQYVFAMLAPGTIRMLATYMQEGDAKSEGGSRKQREIYAIWPDFDLEGHIYRTGATIKSDAARASFNAKGDGIVWAVVDSGISGDHWHFKRHGNLDLSGFDSTLRHMDFTQDWEDITDLPEADRKKSAKAEEKAALTDQFGHGTHVAGIIAGEYLTDESDGWSGSGTVPKSDLHFKNEAFVYFKRRTEDNQVAYDQARMATLSGMSPRTKLVSFKVLDDRGAGEVSNIIAALAQIQEINEYGRYLRIHGVNLSVGYPFNPEWFACGASPLCVEVDRLVKSGVVVVVSAGNSGYGTKQTLMTRKVRAGMLMTINDPGNARHAITVGSTHSVEPHEFGPSFFSSKGPTGDGRLKPDLLAPGERIVSCGAGASADGKGRPQDHNRLYVDQSGTSMAAPHVSGAIAAFLSVRNEFIGQPERVKEIFVGAATDLGRDRNMQGAGLLDLMRAMQSV